MLIDAFCVASILDVGETLRQGSSLGLLESTATLLESLFNAAERGSSSERLGFLGPRTDVRAGLPVHPGEASLDTRAEVQSLQDLKCGVF